MPESTPTTRTIIGLEIHVQLQTESKMFCGCPVKFDAPPNSCVCPVCLGHPGSLPVINRLAFEYALLTGLALNCEIARHTKWDRKSYYYPDLPKNYQISQYDLPLARKGYFEIPTSGNKKRIRITRAHLEEDAGKNLHDVPGCTLVDLNRAGTPLLEIVTEPDLSSADEAYTFCTELQRLVTYLGVSEGNMQKGQMRFEPNVNMAIECDGKEYRTPIAEVKNLNSFRAVRDAIIYEAERQVAAWKEDHDYQQGKRPNENRGWNAEKGMTEFQRAKEAAHDYRYFPDPDLVPVEITDKMLNEIRAMLPELPIVRRQRFVIEYGLSTKDAETIVDHRGTADLFEEVIAAGAPTNVVSKQFVNVWLKLANDRHAHVTDLGVDAARMAELARITADGTVNKTAANRLAEAMLEYREPRASARADVCGTGFQPVEHHPTPSPMLLAEELGLVQVRDIAATEAWIAQAFAANEKAAQDALKNPRKAKAAAGFLRGQVMKLSGGKADPKLVGRLIEQRLAEKRS
ncbi:MAG: Asp-tRNA(Asn)/Glu-tRNA(Gln) amidotransferase subunit GatB [Phycisphaerae bacterium]